MKKMLITGEPNPVYALDLGPESTPVLDEAAYIRAIDEHDLSPAEAALAYTALQGGGVGSVAWEERIRLGHLPRDSADTPPHLAFVLKPGEYTQIRNIQRGNAA
jgi:hypothetical protein